MEGAFFLCSVLLIPKVQPLAEKLREIVVAGGCWLVHPNSVVQVLSDSHCRLGVTTDRIGSVDPQLVLVAKQEWLVASKTCLSHEHRCSESV